MPDENWIQIPSKSQELKRRWDLILIGCQLHIAHIMISILFQNKYT